MLAFGTTARKGGRVGYDWQRGQKKVERPA